MSEILYQAKKNTTSSLKDGDNLAVALTQLNEIIGFGYHVGVFIVTTNGPVVYEFNNSGIVATELSDFKGKNSVMYRVMYELRNVSDAIGGSQQPQNYSRLTSVVPASCSSSDFAGSHKATMNPEAQTLRIVLQREAPGQSWGFRMQGGSDFTTPLSVQMVNPGGLADRSGVMAGDAILQINNRATECMEHEEAKREILMCGESVTLLVQRGAVKVWRPKVTPMSDLRPGELPRGPEGEVYVQKTSLAANHSESPYSNVGSSYNRAARPFAGFGGGAPSSQPPVAPPQYGGGSGYATAENSQQDYSAQQSRMAAGMAKISTNDDSENNNINNNKSPIVRDGKAPELNRDEADRREASPGQPYVAGTTQEMGSSEEAQVGADYKQSKSFKILEEALSQAEVSGIVGGASPGGGGKVPGFRSVTAPTTKPPGEKQTGQYITCSVCGMLIAGVFVKIRGNPMHPECFKCCQCGKNLKNQGYFDIEGQLYCDVHAQQAAQPPGPDMVAVPTYR
ncbi:PDZ and LIM domain protein Zasp [Lamellibrachia satsuma]|nr:PDZ and LIM domain protein Zasp [Lamellibrachia satsuma]